MENKIITAKQCRAAREFLEWKQKDLCEKSSIAISTIADFERGYSQPIVRTLKELRRVFEDSGIEFVDDKTGEGVKLLKKK
jgi:transcriptional regulator with XRE-family HTH domain